MRKLCFLMMMICAFALSANAQQAKPKDSVKYVNKLMVLGKYMGDSVVLRWTTANYPLWLAVRKAGVEVYRAEFNATTNSLEHQKKLTSLPLKPMTLEEMKKHFSKNDTTAAMIAQVMYGGTLNGKQQTQNLENLDVMEAEQSNRFVYATYLADLYPNIASAIALRFVDKTAVKGKTYYYYLKSDIKTPGLVFEESGAMVNTNIHVKPEKLQSVDAIGLDRSARLFWSRLEGDARFTAYQVERKDGSGRFNTRTASPFINPNSPKDNTDDETIVFMDSIPQNYVPYQYRVRGITPFGEPSEWAEITVSGRDLTPPAMPVNVVATSQGGKKVKVTWKMPTKNKDLAGFVIGRSENYDGPYTPIDEKLYGMTDTIGFDLNANIHQRNFYLVSAIDTAGNAARSLPAYSVIIDSIAPAKPLGLTATIDSLGVVKLHWPMGKEVDLAGYNVYRANNPKEEFSVINKTQIQDNNYMDMVDINSLTKDVYYKIVAFDKSSNPSAYSDFVRLKKPDYIPPVAPQITEFLVEEDRVKLKFMASNSNDLKEYYVYRKVDTTFEKIATLLKSDSVFVDLKLPEKNLLWYTMVAVDSAGLQSEQAFPQRITLPIKAAALPSVMLSAKKTDKGIVISWDKSIQWPKGAKLMLYKSYSKDALEQYKLIDNLNEDFTDVEFEKNETIAYAVRLQLANGVLSSLSNKVELK